MVKVFVELIIAKRRAFADVPVLIQAAVAAEVKLRGYDTDGNLIKEG